MYLSHLDPKSLLVSLWGGGAAHQWASELDSFRNLHKLMEFFIIISIGYIWQCKLCISFFPILPYFPYLSPQQSCKWCLYGPAVSWWLSNLERFIFKFQRKKAFIHWARRLIENFVDLCDSIKQTVATKRLLLLWCVTQALIQWFMDDEPSCRVKNISSDVTTASLSFYRHCLQPYQWAPSPPMELSLVSLEILHSCYRFYPQYIIHILLSGNLRGLENQNGCVCDRHIDFYVPFVF